MNAPPIPIPIRIAAPDLAARLRAILWGLAIVIANALLRTPLADLAGPASALLTRTAKRFIALAGHVNDGRLPRRRAGRSRSGAAPKPRLRTYGWLLHHGRHHAAYWRNQLEALLNEPMFGAFLAAAPTAGRLLRPVCLLLALKPAILYPDRPRPPPMPAPRREPAPASAEVPPDLPPRRVWTVETRPSPRPAPRRRVRDLPAKNRT